MAMSFDEWWEQSKALFDADHRNFSRYAAKEAWATATAEANSLRDAVRALNYHTRKWLPRTEGSFFSADVAARLEELQRLVPPAP